jgi:hypothetical protein
MSFDKEIKKAFDAAKAKLDKRYEESAKMVDEKIREVQGKTYKRLGKET